jgi:DNA-directed RNA polymerase specialized sigma24 family protein
MKSYTNDLRHRILREAYKNYHQWEYLMQAEDARLETIEYAIETEEGSGDYVPITISFTDLKLALQHVKLAPRKKEAFYLNVILGYKQREAAAKMGISPVSVGQYVESAMLQLAKYYFADAEDNDPDTVEVSVTSGE